MKRFIFFASLFFASSWVTAFQPLLTFSTPRLATCLHDTAQVEAVVAERYPNFMSLILSKNTEMWKKLSDASDSGGITLFCPTDAAIRDLGDKRLEQLQDVRNGETVEKMAAFHAVNEPVSADELFASGGVITLGGVVDVERSTLGGFMGFGGKEDGGVTVNGAKVLESMTVDNCIIHEVDSLVSPEILWRYCDQLRIPGSR